MNSNRLDYTILKLDSEGITKVSLDALSSIRIITDFLMRKETGKKKSSRKVLARSLPENKLESIVAKALEIGANRLTEKDFKITLTKNVRVIEMPDITYMARFDGGHKGNVIKILDNTGIVKVSHSPVYIVLPGEHPEFSGVVTAPSFKPSMVAVKKELNSMNINNR